MKHTWKLKGQTLVEFALIFPLLIFLLIGFFDLGRAVFYYASLSNAVREATRKGTVKFYGDYLDEADFKAQMKDQVLAYGFGMNSLTTEDVTVEVNEIDPSYFDSYPSYEYDDEFIQYIEVTGKYCYEPITPGIISIINTTCWDGSKGIELKAVSVMWMEPGSGIE